VVLTEDGTIFVSKSESYFIVDELNANSRIINLTNVPAANYIK
jgi:hypothetical protein